MSSSKLMLDQTERVNRVRSDLSLGLPCVLTHAGYQALIVPLETVAAARFATLKEILGTPELVISAKRARAVMSVAASANLADGPVRICPPEGADFAWYQRLADPKFDQTAGVAGPLHVLRVGERTLHEAGMSLIKSVELIPAFALFEIGDKISVLRDLPLTQLTADEALAYKAAAPKLAPVASASLPLEAYNVSRLHVFRDPDGQREHYAIEIGNPDLSRPVLTRLHSACFT
ncbi:MAG: GTP cyclohydrolase II, partial [Pseudomonadota bacterium]